MLLGVLTLAVMMLHSNNCLKYAPKHLQNSIYLSWSQSWTLIQFDKRTKCLSMYVFDVKIMATGRFEPLNLGIGSNHTTFDKKKALLFRCGWFLWYLCGFQMEEGEGEPPGKSPGFRVLTYTNRKQTFSVITRYLFGILFNFQWYTYYPDQF